MRGFGALALVLGAAAPAAAHTGGLRMDSEPVSVPFWLFLLTGGGVVCASFLFTSFVTDRELVTAAADRWPLPLDHTSVARLGGMLGLLALALVVVGGALGPQEATQNVAVLGVWVGWWAGFTMSVYLLGNSWPAIDPFRRLAGLLPTGTRPYPDRFGAWPSVVGLLALVWLEVVSPLSESPRLLVAAVVGYAVVTLAGAGVYGADTWFERVDPIARAFRTYGLVAPIRRGADGLELGMPGVATDRAPAAPFVVALLWATTYDGFVSTQSGAATVRAVVEAGVPPRAAYALLLILGFGLFLGVYRLACRLSRRSASTYVTPAVIATRFAPSLVPIAAGDHLAHYLGYFLNYLPALGVVLTNPFAPSEVVPLALPSWFGGIALSFVIVGHMLAVWSAHATAFDLFTGRLQPIRSQYPFVVVMVLYTMASLWLLAQPGALPPYV